MRVSPYQSSRLGALMLGCAGGCGCGCGTSGLGRLGDATGASAASTYASYAKAVYQAYKGDVGGAGVTAMSAAAGPLAVIGFAIANFANRGKKKDNEIIGAFLDAMTTDVGFGILMCGKAYQYLTPDSLRVLNANDQALQAARAIANGASSDVVFSTFKAWMDTARPWKPGMCNVVKPAKDLPPPVYVVPQSSPTPAPAPVPVASPTATPAPATASLLTPAPISAAPSGASMTTVAELQQKASTVSGSGPTLLANYSAVAGTVPGRLLGTSKMEGVIAAIGQAGKWPNVKKWGDAVVDQVVMTGCKGCTPPTMIDWVKANVAKGQNNPVSLVDQWGQLVQSTWGSKWLVPSAGALQRQALIDTLDSLIAQVDPNAPLYYAQPTTATASPSPTPTPSSTMIPQPTPVPVTTLPAISTGLVTPSPVPTVVQAPTSATDPNLLAFLKQLQDQGASQQQAYAAALQALQNQGVQATPAVQQAVAGAVQETSPQPASATYLAIGAVAIIGVGILMSNRKKGRRR